MRASSGRASGVVAGVSVIIGPFVFGVPRRGTGSRPRQLHVIISCRDCTKRAAFLDTAARTGGFLARRGAPGLTAARRGVVMQRIATCATPEERADGLRIPAVPTHPQMGPVT